jgi:hypothetical protein
LKRAVDWVLSTLPAGADYFDIKALVRLNKYFSYFIFARPNDRQNRRIARM